MAITAIDEHVANLTASDAEWKELLITAPARGLASYQQLADASKEALARSNAFERAFFGPSRKATAGCYAPLRADFEGLLKKLPHDTQNALDEALSQDPITSVLFTRLVACTALDGDENLAQVWANFPLRGLRASRGPRMAMYYASLDALPKIVGDRPKFPLAVDKFRFPRVSYDLSTAVSKIKKKKENGGYGASQKSKGIVKSVKKTPAGLAITWLTDKHNETWPNCESTGRIMSFFPDGTPQYYQVCKGTITITVNETPDAVTVPLESAEGIAPGAAIEILSNSDQVKLGVPKFVYKDKSRKQLVNWYGFGL
jgi:hypothetical protein